MNKFKVLVVLIIMFTGIIEVKAFDSSIKIYDYAQILTPSNETQLKNKLDSYIKTYDMDMVLVSVKYHKQSSVESYARSFYMTHDFGIGDTKDGIIAIIDFTSGKEKIYIEPYGNATKFYNDARINNMINKMSNKEKYYSKFDIFIKYSENYAKIGTPKINEATEFKGIDNNLNKTLINILIIILISSIIPTVILIYLILEGRRVKKQNTTKSYIKKDSVVINTKTDRYVTTHTKKMRISKSKKIKE